MPRGGKNQGWRVIRSFGRKLPLWAYFSTFSTQLKQDIIYKFTLTRYSSSRAAKKCDYHQTAIYHLPPPPPPLFLSSVPNHFRTRYLKKRQNCWSRIDLVQLPPREEIWH